VNCYQAMDPAVPFGGYIFLVRKDWTSDRSATCKTRIRSLMKFLQIGKSIDGQLVGIAMSSHGQISNVLVYPFTRVGQRLVIQSMDESVCVQNSLN
jgi:hypothetical protein